MNTTNTQTRHHVPFTQLFAFGVGGIIPIALFNIAGQLMGLIGNICLGLSAFWLGVILIIPRLWDAISDPIVGHISDNTRSRWGRRRPYLLLGGIAVAISFVLMWWIPKGEIIQQSQRINGFSWVIYCFGYSFFLQPVPFLKFLMALWAWKCPETVTNELDSLVQKVFLEIFLQWVRHGYLH